MSIFEIIPDEQTPAVPEIENIQEYIQANNAILQEFLENCRWRLNAAGLACNQLSLNGERFMLRAFAYIDKSDKIWRVAIDPKIDEYIGIKEFKTEGCLTWKDKIIVALRSRAVKVSYYDLQGNFHENAIYKGFMGQVWQHEVNHLNGIPERIEELDFPEPKPIEAQRNDKCPCGSGKKYKQCCLLLA